jgi:hypothetical protein
MQNIQKIMQLQNELSLLVAEEVKNLETMSLIPDNLTDETNTDEYWDWLYDLPIVNVEGQGYYIVGILKTLHDDLYLNVQNVDDSRDVIQISFYELSLSNKTHLLHSVNDVIEYNKKLKQTL